MRGRRSKLTWLLGLVLFSAAGLVAFGVMGLQKNAEKAQATAVQESGRAAQAQAKRLSQAVQDLALLDLVPHDRRFSVDEDGRLVIPEGIGWIGWIGEPQVRLDSLRPAWPAREAVRLAQQKELVDQDGSAAVEVLSEALEDLPAAKDQGFLLSRAAWCAHRAGLAERRDQFLGAFDNIKAPSFGDLGSALRLRALISKMISVPCRAYILRLPYAQALAFLDRLSVAKTSEHDRLAAQLRVVRDQRRLLSQVNARLDSLTSAGKFAVAPMGQELILYFPRERQGEGCVLKPERLVALLGFDVERFHVGRRHPAETIVALPLIAAVPTLVVDEDSWSESGIVSAMLALLALSFCLGLFFTLRAVSREALASQARSEFLTSVTHELKTPLASIRLLAEMLENNLVLGDKKRHEYHRLLSSESARLSMLIENVLDLRRMERGERAYDMRPCDMNDTVTEAVALFLPIAERDGLSVSVNLVAGDHQATVDRGALIQVLEGRVRGNVARFTGKDIAIS